VDFIVSSEEQDHHEQLKPEFLERPDMVACLERLGYAPADFFDDSIYPLLERPLPWLCADRLDYFFRDGLACGAAGRDQVDRFLGHLRVIESTIVFTRADVAREAVEIYSVMNRDWWASGIEAYIYNEFADALREGFRSGALQRRDLLTDDESVMAKLRGSGNALIAEKLGRILDLDPDRIAGYVPRVVPKSRWLDPPVVWGSSFRRLSELT
jgi:HD superfamily phosphohydrolase